MPADPPRRCCKTCAFWLRADNKDYTESGQCRRYPVWVTQRSSHWCGEHHRLEELCPDQRPEGR